MFHERILSFLSIATAYGAVVCTVYLVAYWGTFDINILEYVGLSDVIKLAVYPIIVGIAAMSGGYVLVSMYETLKQNSLSKTQSIPLETKAEDPPNATKVLSDEPDSGTVGKFLAKVKIHHIAIFTSLALFLIFALTRDPYIWILASVLFAILGAAAIMDHHLVVSFLPDLTIRHTIVYSAVFLICLSFGVAKRNALTILAGRDVKRVSTKILKGYGTEEFISRGILDRDETLKFLGVAGDYFFFLREDNTAVYAFKYEELLFLEVWH